MSGRRDARLHIAAQYRGAAVVAVAKRLGRPPIVHARNPGAEQLASTRSGTRPVALGNVDTQATFTGSFDEKWFYLATLGVELAGAPAMVGTCRCGRIARSDGGDTRLRATHLPQSKPASGGMIAALMRMRERCDPYVFYHRIRPYLAGWPAPGLIYSGSGTQTADLVRRQRRAKLAAAIDRCRARHRARKSGHTRFPERDAAIHAAEASRLCGGVAREQHDPRRARCTGTRRCVRSTTPASPRTDELRRKHIGITSEYILKQADVVVGPGTTGTGGTDFVEFLRESRVETARSQLK